MPRFTPVKVTNFSDEVFSRPYGKDEQGQEILYTLRPGETLVLPSEVATLLARHLAHREYAKIAGKAKFEKGYRFNRGDWEMLYKRALPEGEPKPVVEAVPAKPEPEPAPVLEPEVEIPSAETLAEEIEEVFEEKPVETPKAKK